jgi:hypothetical protein
VDEAAYRAAAHAANPQPCVFAIALAAGCAGCEASARRSLAERETIACTSPVARTNCATLFALLRERCAFALKIRPEVEVPHAAATRLACGGLAGLFGVVAATQADVHRCVVAAQERYGSLSALPWPPIAEAVRAWQGRRRRTGRAR